MSTPPLQAVRVTSAATRARRREVAAASLGDQEVSPAPTPGEPDPAMDDARALERSLRGVVASLQRTLDEVQPAVTPVQLWCLRELEAGGSATVGDLAEALRVAPSTISRNADRLVAAGLVSRRAHHVDRRQVTVKLTRAGGRLLAETSEARARVLHETVTRMSADDRDSLVRGAEAFADARAAHDHDDRTGPAPRR